MSATFIALLRGVNVGGANCVSSKDVVQSLEAIGLKNVRTYIQSGNAVFQSNATGATALPAKISKRFQRSHGFAPEVIVLRMDELEAAIAANPYSKADANPKALHLTFLAAAPKAPDLTPLENVRQDGEQYMLKGRVFYFWAPEGIGRSKTFARVEKTLGVACTARNWRTVCELLKLAREIAV